MRNGFTLPSSFLFAASTVVLLCPGHLTVCRVGCNTYHPYGGRLISVLLLYLLLTDSPKTWYGPGPFPSSGKWLVGSEQLITFAIGQSMQKLVFWRPSSSGTSAGSIIFCTSSWIGFRKENSPPFVRGMGYRARLQRTEPARSLVLATAFRPSPFQMPPAGFTRHVPENFSSDASHQEQQSS